MKKTKDVEVGGEKYTVREISIGEVLPILPRLEGPEQTEAQLDLMKICIMQDGAALGDAVRELGLSTYLSLAEFVMEVNGLRATEGKG